MLLFTLISNPPHSRAADIIFKLRTFAEAPVAGRIEISVPQKSNEVSDSWRVVLVLDKGEGKYPAKCEPPGILFRAAPFDQTYYLERPEMIKPCAVGEILFHFRRKDYASTLTEALSNDTPVLTAASASAKTLHFIVLQTLKTGNYPAAATNSILLRDEIEKQFGTKAAEPYRVLSEDITTSFISGGQPLIFDARKKQYVLAPSTVRDVAQYQKRKGLAATGVLTLSTARSLPDASDDNAIAHVDGPL
jgi:hypothetical protein